MIIVQVGQHNMIDVLSSDTNRFKKRPRVIAGLKNLSVNNAFAVFVCALSQRDDGCGEVA